jgi:NitT/TauT family transport system permease protein
MIEPRPTLELEEEAPQPRTASRRRPRWRRPARVLLEVVVSLVVLTVAAEIILRILDVKTFLVPKPTTVAESFADNWDVLWTNSLVTLKEVVLGFAVAAAGGFLLAVLIVYVPLLSRVLYPLIVASQTIPKIAIAPLLVVWFGFGLAPKIIVVFLIAFFPVVIASTVGLRAVDENMLHLVRSMGAGPLQAFYKVRLVNAVPSIFSGLKIAVTLSVVGAIVGEFVGADAGLGYLLLIANGQLDTPLMFAAVVVLSVMGVVLFGLVSAVERITPGHLRDQGGAEDVSAATL